MVAGGTPLGGHFEAVDLEVLGGVSAPAVPPSAHTGLAPARPHHGRTAAGAAQLFQDERSRRKLLSPCYHCARHVLVMCVMCESSRCWAK